jgi:hypothetical protein
VSASPPDDPLIYHITHVDNLVGILREGCIWSDAECAAQGLVPTNVGYRHIKQRRLARRVNVAVGGMLGDYVPFNFCPRSVMLYVINRGHEDYRGGQDEIVHLVSRVSQVMSCRRPWAFTDRHADLAYAEYYDDLDDLVEVPWNAMPEIYWTAVKEERQAEFLVHEQLPWSAITLIGVRSPQVHAKVLATLAHHAHQPRVELRPQWYY